NTLNNALTGNSGDNILDGLAGADAMAGGAGNDTYVVDNVGDVVTESVNGGTRKVNASISYTLTPHIENILLTGSTDLQTYGNTLANTLTGNMGNNVLDGGAGGDAMYGGAGNDAYFVDSAGDFVIENSNEGNDTVYASVSYLLGANVENLIL